MCFLKIFIAQTVQYSIYTVCTRINYKIVLVTNLNKYSTVQVELNSVYIYIYIYIYKSANNADVLSPALPYKKELSLNFQYSLED